MTYDNVGGKIKGLAKVIFGLEAFSAVIAGILIIAYDDDLAAFGIIFIFIGILLSWISSLVLYGFGELIEKTVKNEENTRTIAELLRESNNKPTAQIIASAVRGPQTTSPTANTSPVTSTARIITTQNNTIICSACKCEQPTGRQVCWHCGASFVAETSATHQWRCDKCGKMRTNTPCEYCGQY